MPIMPRPKGKATKIAYDILGVPENMREDKRNTVGNKRDKEIRDRINRDNITRDR